MKPFIIYIFLSLTVFADLDSSLTNLYNHLNKKKPLSTAELLEIDKEIENNSKDFSSNEKLISKGFNIVKIYEEKNGALFLNQKTKGGFNRNKYEGIEIERVLFSLQQALIDHAFTGEVFQRNPQLFKVAFKTSDYFPGKCDSPDPDKILSVKMNATQIEGYGFPLGEDESPVRRPTGWYLPAGEVAILNFPPELIKKGYNIRVGAHSWNLEKKGQVKRLDRVSLVYPINEKNVEIAHPLGGGIYLEVPWLANEGIVTIKAINVAEAPFFHNRAYDESPSADIDTEMDKPAPWVDIETDSYMAQIPRAWGEEIEDPQKMMDAYDEGMKYYSKIVGRPHIRSKSVLYHQIDVIFRGSAFFPGYPMSNFNWNPLKPEITNGNRWVIEGTKNAPSVLFHEMGHASRITKFIGEVEAVVNFPYVYVHNQLHGKSLDQAFAHSFRGNNKMTIDFAAANRMISETFRAGKPANVSNKPGDEVKYQHRGYAIYADIAKLYGWEPLLQFWDNDQKNYIAGKNFKFIDGRNFPTEPNRDPTDNRILRLSIEAGEDLTPLAHFWGKHPNNLDALKNAMNKNNLKPSAKVYDRLEHYKSVIPMDAKQFLAHAKILFPKVEKPGVGKLNINPLFGHGWYHKMLKVYKESHAQTIQQELQKIIDLYYPDGRPQE